MPFDAEACARIVRTVAEQSRPSYVTCKRDMFVLQLNATLFGCATSLPATLPLNCCSLLDLHPAAHSGGGTGHIPPSTEHIFGAKTS